MSMPIPRASKGPLPVYTSRRSYPSMDRWAVSLPALMPGPMGSQMPPWPWVRNQSRFGCLMYCSGVRPLSSGQALSPSPSMITMSIFFSAAMIAPTLDVLPRLLWVLRD